MWLQGLSWERCLLLAGKLQRFCIEEEKMLDKDIIVKKENVLE